MNTFASLTNDKCIVGSCKHYGLYIQTVFLVEVALTRTLEVKICDFLEHFAGISSAGSRFLINVLYHLASRYLVDAETQSYFGSHFQILGSIFREEVRIQFVCFQMCFIALYTFLLLVSELLYYAARSMF